MYKLSKHETTTNRDFRIITFGHLEISAVVRRLKSMSLNLVNQKPHASKE